MNCLRASWICLAFALAFAANVPAASVIDQQYFVNPSLNNAHVQGGVSLAQTFTVGISGVLDRLDLQVGREGFPGTLDVLVRRTLGDGFPDPSPAAVLASVTVDRSLFPIVVFPTEFVPIVLGAESFPVIAGDRLAIELRSETASNAPYGWATWDETFAPPTPGYSGGTAYFRIPPSAASFSVEPLRDRGFRTYVEVVPEPSAVALAITGLIGGYVAGRWSARK